MEGCTVLDNDRRGNNYIHRFIRKMKIEDVLFVVFAIAAIALAAWYLFGRSPTLEQALLVLIIGLVIKNHGDIKEIRGQLSQ